MSDKNEKSDDTMIETTIGELICAIADAAKEARIDEQDLFLLTHLVLNRILERVNDHSPELSQ